jgi:hypothetical protein
MKNQVGYLNVVGERNETFCENLFLLQISEFNPFYELFVFSCVILYFAVPPDILDYPTSTDMVVRESSNVTLRCAARGSPTPTITWRRENGEPIVISSKSEGKRKN